MRDLEGRVAIVTGAGNGLGRAYAHFLAAHGAAVVVNDLGCTVTGEAAGHPAAQRVVDEIVAAGGRAVSSMHDVADWTQAADLVALAVASFGSLDVLVNNAGIARRADLADMVEADWDAVVRVHLKGHAAPTCHAMAYWRGRPASARTDASVIHTTSAASLTARGGRGSYSAAKAGVIGLSKAVVAEGGEFGVRSNVVAPSASTRLTGPREDLGDVDANAPIVGWLARAGCPANDQLIQISGRRILLLQNAAIAVDLVAAADRWDMAALDAALCGRLVSQTTIDALLAGGRCTNQ